MLEIGGRRWLIADPQSSLKNSFTPSQTAATENEEAAIAG
jgi:hypothetical protein